MYHSIKKTVTVFSFYTIENTRNVFFGVHDIKYDVTERDINVIRDT